MKKCNFVFHQAKSKTILISGCDIHPIMFEPIIPSLLYLAVHAIDAGACDISLVKHDLAVFLNHEKFN